ncbi:MAG: hypothetical protein K2H22_06605, partial [Muribaculaceae bacterium]|nr:hypothetical protein [Muribaculaceae bacterium]
GKVVRVASLADSSVFAYDAEYGSLLPERGYVINSTPDKLFPLYFYEDVKIGLQHRNPEAAPDAPFDVTYIESEWGNSVFFMLPNVDENGEILHAENLYYEIYVNGELQYFDIVDDDWNVENTSLIPYLYDDWEDFWVDTKDPRDHTVYLYNDEEVKNIGIRSIYVNENGENIYSKMGYWDEFSGIAVTGADNVPVSVKWYDLQGRPLNGKIPGVSVQVTTYSDGSVVRSKVYCK